MKKLPPYQVGGAFDDAQVFTGDDPKTFFEIAGIQHIEGVKLVAYNEVNNNQSYALWNTNLQYSSMTFTIGNLDGHSENIKLDIYLDGELSTSYDVKWDNPPKTITVPLNFAANVKLNIQDATRNNHHWAGYGIYDISFQ